MSVQIDYNSLNKQHLYNNLPDGEEVVISGMAGVFSDSYNIRHLRENLYNKIDMTTEEHGRWSLKHPDMPKRRGRIFDVEKFDAGYFGIHYRQAHAMDPQIRLLLERTAEAIMDAGLHPDDLIGTKTGVFVGMAISESESAWCGNKLLPQYFHMTGLMRSMAANRISYYLKLKGPSYTTNAACASSASALEHAFRAIRNGDCDNAIVGGTHLSLGPYFVLQLKDLGVLSLDGIPKVFDENADGYTISEAIVAILLQKSKNSKRIYAKIIHSKQNNDGYKAEGITHPSAEGQAALLKETYEEANFNPDHLTYLDMHGTGTTVGDPIELKVINEVFCKNRPSQLLIGSVKSNLGHAESASGLVSVIKILAGAEDDIILPNLHFNTPRKGVEVFEKNRAKVVTETTPLLDDDNRIFGMNNYGFGGVNCHTLLDCRRRKCRKNPFKNALPRLVCISGRTEKTVCSFFDDLLKNKADEEYIALCHNIFRKNIPGHLYRGYSILTQNNEHRCSYQFYKQEKKPLNVVFTDFGDKWVVILKNFGQLPVLRETLQKIQKVLTKNGLKLPKYFNADTVDVKKHNFDGFDKIFGTAIVQIGIAEILKRIHLEPINVFGKGVADLVCGYFSESLTLEETILSIYYLAQFTDNCRQTEDSNNDKAELLKNLQKILPKLKTRGQSWISPIKNQQFLAELFLQSLNSFSVNHLFDYLNNNSVLLEIGFGLLREHSNGSFTYLSIDSSSNENVIFQSLQVLGELYLLGHDLNLLELYPKIEFPDWFVYRLETKTEEAVELSFKINVSEEEWSFLKGYIIDGRNLFPAAGYLYLVWESLVQQFGITIGESKVIFENCRFVRALSLVEQCNHEIIVSVQRSSGKFIVSENETVLASGTVRLVDSIDLVPIEMKKNDNSLNMQHKDIYKELKLRGYHYMNDFKKIQEASLDGRYCLAQWNENWICFIEIMFQLSLFQRDTRLLYVPTGIKRVTIDGPKHIQAVSKLNKDTLNMPVCNFPEIGLIRSGSIEVQNLQTTSISRRKHQKEPVLERYEFAPNISRTLTIKDAIRIDLQLIFENLPSVSIKILELIDEASDRNCEILSPILLQTLTHLPVNPNVTILSKNPISINEVPVENKALSSDADCHLVVGSKLLQRHTVLNQCFAAVKTNGFVLSRESCNFQKENLENYEIITRFHQEKETLVLIRQKINSSPPTVVEISENEDEFDWLPKLQECLNKNEHVVLVAQKQSTNGILGLTNCLRREPSGTCIKCFFIMDHTMPKFDLNNAFYKEQFAKNLAVNILKDSQWGTYRHLLLDLNRTVKKQHCFCNNLTRGDLTSLRWLEGPLHHGYRTEDDQELVYIYYSALNFKDVMLATGKINVDTVSSDRLLQQCVLGFEFVGRTQEGRRVMGTVVAGAMSTMVAANKDALITIPDEWTMEEAATVCVVYETVLMALVQVGQIQCNQTILIHAGTGGIGLAAITVALYFGCKVYTTVGTEEKREFIKKRFPQIKDHQIGNSRDTSFEQMIKKQTHGRGVDVVLNSLADEKLMASVRCLAHGGKFLEIGKFDLANDIELSLLLLEKEASFHGIMLDHLLNNTSTIRTEFMNFMKRCIESKIVQPLTRTVFEMDEVEKAYRFLSIGKHVGKIVLEIRKEEEDQMAIPVPIMKPCLPKFVLKGVYSRVHFQKRQMVDVERHIYHCASDKVYVVIGGLGGFALELVDWLILRGARKLILTSRNGIRTGYQGYKINLWSKYADIHISTANAGTKEGCEDLLQNAGKLGPVTAIFNLAMVLNDCLIENQTVEKFRNVWAPKAIATKYLDEISRKLCPYLRDFVVFSSASCGRGNSGQTNYGMANSIMERICEQRRAEGLPGLAIQWGNIGDVGALADIEKDNEDFELGGTLPQRISSCFNVIDSLLSQPYPIVSSTIIAVKKQNTKKTRISIATTIANILGINDVKTVSRYATLPEIGMDSMSGAEVQQILERDFDLFLTQKELRELTFNQLDEIEESKSNEPEASA